MKRVHIDCINNEDPAKSAKINDDDSIFYQSGKVDYNKIKKGDILSRSSYYKVIQKDEENKKFVVENEWGSKIEMDEHMAKQEFYSASNVINEVHLTHRQIVNQLKHVDGSVLFTVCYRKQPTTQLMQQMIEDKIQKNKKITKVFCAELLTKGESREIVARMKNLDELMGRTYVFDLEIDARHNRIRCIDNRTIEWLIYKGTKYIVK